MYDLEISRDEKLSTSADGGKKGDVGLCDVCGYYYDLMDEPTLMHLVQISCPTPGRITYHISEYCSQHIEFPELKNTRSSAGLAERLEEYQISIIKI